MKKIILILGGTLLVGCAAPNQIAERGGNQSVTSGYSSANEAGLAEQYDRWHPGANLKKWKQQIYARRDAYRAKKAAQGQ